jgi:hypothetical protein
MSNKSSSMPRLLGNSMSRVWSEVKHENSKSSVNEKAEILTQPKSLHFEFITCFIVLQSIRLYLAE